MLARPLLRRAKDVGWTIVLLLLVGVLLGLVFVTGGLFGRLVELVGLGHVGTAVWDVLHWPVAFLVGMVVVAVVVFTAPSERPRAFRPWTLGSLFSVLVFLTASAVYAVYVANIGNHNATYGAFAAVVILMLWAWMAGLAFLFGAELDAQLDAGGPGLCAPTTPGWRGMLLDSAWSADVVREPLRIPGDAAVLGLRVAAALPLHDVPPAVDLWDSSYQATRAGRASRHRAIPEGP